MHTHQDATLLHAFFVFLDAFLRHVPADQRPNQPAAGSASAGTGNGCRNRAGNHQAEAWQCQGGANSGNGSRDGAQRAANGAANARAFGSAGR